MTLMRALLLVATAASLQARPASAQEDGSLTLEGAVRKALVTHPTASAAQAGVDLTSARLGEQLSRRLPSLSLDASLIQYQKPSLVAPIHALNASAVQFDRTLVQGSLRAGYTVWDGGTRGAEINAARAQDAGAEFDRHAALMDLILLVSTDYLRVLSAREELTAVDASLVALGAERDRVERFVREGAAARIELLRVEAAQEETVAERTTAAIELANAVAALARSLSEPLPGFGDRPLTPVHLARGRLPTRDTLEALYQARNPDLQRVDAAVDAARWQERAVSATWFPRLDVVGGYLLFGSAEGPFAAEWQAGLAVTYPLFLGGRRSAAGAAAAAGLAQAQARSAEVRIASANAFDRAIGNTREFAAQVVALTRKAAQVEEIVRIERLSLESGLGTQAEFLRTEADLRHTRALLARTRHLEILAHLELARLIGVLDIDWLAKTLENAP